MAEVPVPSVPPAGGLVRGTVAGVATTALGAVLAVLMLVWAPGRLTGWSQFFLLLLASALLYAGAQALARRRLGEGFDLLTWLCAAWLVVVILGALLAPVLPLGEDRDLAAALANPVNQPPDVLSAHPLGTNNGGLDLLARILFGARASLVVAIGAVLVGMAVGGAVGIIAGFRRGRTDTVVGVLTNALLAIPPLILLIALATVLDPTLRNIALGLSLLALPSMLRVARANTMAFAQREFVTAARAMGATDLRVMAKELLPNVVLPLASYGMVMISILIVAEASLSFLGLGIHPPAPSWGNMIAEGQTGDVLEQYPHIVMVPGSVLFLTVFAFNVLGERARAHFDPRAAKP